MEVPQIKYTMDSRTSRIAWAFKCGYCSAYNHAKANCVIWQQHNCTNTVEVK
jgi:hypothetical protein